MYESVAALLARLGREFGKLRADPWEWFVLVGGRLELAGLLTSVFALGVLVLMVTGVVDVRRTTRLLYVFQVLVAGNLTLITIVLSINQLVLSREFKTPGELRDQIENVVSFRDGVEEAIDRPAAPVTPADFLIAVLGGLRDTAERLRDVVEEQGDDRLADEVDGLVAEVVSHTDEITDTFDRSEAGIFSALAVTLETNYSHQLNEVHRLQAVYGEDLSPATGEVFDELLWSLKQVDITRQYFKSIYIQSELSSLSRILLYVGVPAIGSALLVLFTYAGAPEPPVGDAYFEVFVPVVLTLGFSPLAILAAFVLRIAMVAERTVAITPFTTPTQESEVGE